MRVVPYPTLSFPAEVSYPGAPGGCRYTRTLSTGAALDLDAQEAEAIGRAGIAWNPQPETGERFERAILDAGPIAFWPWGSHGLYDMSGGGHTGTLQGDASLASRCACGWPSGGVSLDGTGYISSDAGTRRNLATVNTRAAVDATVTSSNSMVSLTRTTSPPAGTDIPTAFSFEMDAANDFVGWEFAATSGVEYTVSAWVYLTTGPDLLEIKVYDAGVTAKATSTDAATTDAWERISVTFTADSTGTWKVRLRQDAAGSVVGYMTGIMVEATDSVGTYFDGTGYVDDAGDWNDSDGIECGWLGTAHASASDYGIFANGTTRTFVALVNQTVAETDVVLAADTSTDEPIALLVSNIGGIQAATNVDAGTAGYYTAAAGFTAGVPQLIASEIDEPNDTIAIRLNGGAEDSESGNTEQYQAAGTTLKIGAKGGASTPFNGLIGPVAVIAGSLTDAEHANLYTELERGLIE